VLPPSSDLKQLSLAKDLVADFSSWLEGVHDGTIKDEGLEWGFAELGTIIHKLRPGELCVVGGRPGAGKTSVANTLVANTCVLFNHPSLVFSLEMPKRQEVMRIASILGNLPLVKLQELNLMSDEDYAILSQALLKIHAANLGISDSVYEIHEIRKETYGLDLVVIDHAQLAKVKDVPDKVLALDEIGRESKVMSKDLECVVMLLTQINKEDTPSWSAALEQHCDQYAIVYKGSYDGKKKVEVRKQRNGPIGEVWVPWRGECAAFF
jgi:replicative DNA helicase